MAKRVKKVLPEGLTLRLDDPGMTPMLRAGLGGLAASLRAIAVARDPAARGAWPVRVGLGPGHADVRPTEVLVHWGAAGPEPVLRALFEESFRLDSTLGLITLPGALGDLTPPPQVANAQQLALKATFLQHGLTTKRRATQTPFTFRVDERPVVVQVQGYEDYAHQLAVESVTTALESGGVGLKGWAYPGAVTRHEKFGGETVFQYDAAQALCALFALVGCVSYTVPATRGGALVIPEPSDLVRFAEVRARLTPATIEDCAVSSTGDATLRAHLALRMESHAAKGRGIASTQAVTLHTTPWASQQKSRVATLEAHDIAPAVLDVFDEVTRSLPARVRVRVAEADKAKTKGKARKPAAPKAGDDEGAGYFVTVSALRGFLCDNLAQGRRWYDGFATATVGLKQPRYIHFYRAPDNLGALFLEEKKGLIKMLDHLEEAELALVRAVHQALRQRFGAIADECGDNAAARKNRMSGERDHWRLLFANSKTPEQIRAALADLWSRGGSNAVLKKHWQEVLPLLRPQHWQTARDLGLVALASYASPVDDDARQDEPTTDSD